ncbi:MAG: hypothetical protein ABR595_06625 [Psychroflexus sp.]
MKDLRKDFDYDASDLKMSENHQPKFESKLNSNFTKPNSISKYYKIASILLVLISSGVFWLTYNQSISVEISEENTRLRLGDISPELQTLENFYLTSINYELATLDADEDFKELVNGYLNELKIIDEEYKTLQNELNQNGINEDLIDAMLENLQLRLELLQDLKNKLNELKSLENGNETTYQI